MNRELSNLFYRLPRLTFLVIGFILLMGISSLVNLPRQEDPTMADRFAAVEVFMPGASALRIEALITEKIESALGEIPEVKQLTSTSSEGFAYIQTELMDEVGKDQVDLVWSEVRNKLFDVEPELPAQATKPQLDVRGPVAITLGIGITSSNTPLSILERVAQELRSRLATLAGTKDTEIYGEPLQEIVIEVDPSAMARANVSLPMLSNLVGASDTKISAGELNSNSSSLVVEVKGELDSIERIKSIPLGVSPNSQLIQLSDIATVAKRYIDPSETMALIHDQRGILVTTTMETGRRVDHWSEAAKQIVDEYRAELPAQIHLEIIIDQNFYAEERLSDLVGNLLLAIAFVLISLFFLMGYRSALIIGSALPLTLAIVLSGFGVLDIPLHQMSVTGLIIALGLLIDNAIVVVEEYKIQRSRDRSYGDAIAAAIRHLFVPLLASTCTTAFAFLPIALTPGAIGDFTGTMAIAVVLSVSASFALAMTIIPSVTAMIDKRFPLENDQSTKWWVSGFSPKGLSNWYRNSIRLVLKNPALGISGSLILPICGFLLAQTMTVSFFPPVDRNQFHLQLNLPATTALTETRIEVERVKAFLAEVPEIRSSHWFIGEASPAVYYNMLSNSDSVASYASAFVTTEDVNDPRKILPGLQKSLMLEFPNARIMAMPFEQGPPFSAPIEIRIVGPELAVLKTLGEQVRLVLSETRDVTYTTATLSGGAPQVSVYTNENKIRLLNMNNQDIPRQLNSELRGEVAGTVMEGTMEIPVRIRLNNWSRSDVSGLASLPIISGTGANGYRGIPLEQVASVRLEPAPTRVDRRQNERHNTVSGFLLPYAYPSLAVNDFRERISNQNIALPKGYRIEYGGEEEQRGDAVSNILATFITFVFLMIAVIVLSLNSFRYAGVIGAVGFLSIGLALLGVWISGYPLGYTAMIGTLGLIGLAINGAIIVLSALKANPAAKGGDVGAATDVVLESTRHIISTTITTIVGFLPLILFGGYFWPPLAMAIAGGVAGSAILALYMVPAFFAIFSRRDARREEHRGLIQKTRSAS